jgi:hypothetical protein
MLREEHGLGAQRIFSFPSHTQHNLTIIINNAADCELNCMLHVSVIYGHLQANTKLTFETVYYVKMTAYWDTAPCSLAEVYFNQTTRRYIRKAIVFILASQNP